MTFEKGGVEIFLSWFEIRTMGCVCGRIEIWRRAFVEKFASRVENRHDFCVVACKSWLNMTERGYFGVENAFLPFA